MYDNVLKSFYTTFVMGMLGDFDTNGFASTAAPWLTMFIFTVVMLFTLVVGLNAIIAILGDSYDRVMDEKVSAANRQKAQLIVDYMVWCRGT